ncbi:cAMP-DEPENDENT SER/THR PROTEIN KINASE (ALPHA SUBUNIT) [Biomphalaria pfeifferi]|uniref:cAMP-DEPENDENT SER/THR PROTEIN KINASE (ALPHA SUBUNIT) n=1 Tax=Biomphalaria pfeifferi TaxID=112525 RepID=A0AAD8EU04_BIOPF|nr:cAMP-DEPENDENT SER/THR PROTEIN KINASE (ALPHA SUBUNIT) [Biomphalaria pfeifferi]
MLKIQDFGLVEILGTGAFGKVHLARLKDSSGSMFAVKILDFRKLLKQRLANQLENEVSILKLLSGSPFVAKLFSTDFCGGKICLILEYVSGGELFYWLKKYRRFSEEITRFYAAEIIFALKFIHGRGILYRDLKPENVLIASTGHIKIIDFGFAVYESESTYVISGTPEYMSPEKLTGESDGRESDYWGLGIMIYEMLCGNPPFYDVSTDVIFRKILECRVSFPPCISSTAKDLITSLLEKNRANRLGFGGIEEIMNHPFFASLSWSDVGNRRLKPPIIPKPFKDINSHSDTDNGSEADISSIRPYRHLKFFQEHGKE